MIDPQRESVCTLDEVSRRLRVHPRTVYNWARRTLGSRLETIKLGGTLRTSWEAVDRFKQSNTPTTKPAERRRSAAAARTKLKELHGI